ncbi:MAG: hypothetical protein M3Z22_01720 [Verrucomicrobiota bacterium]|nr:hypothetical protein [Verrucomicrobiota bacterium]
MKTFSKVSVILASVVLVASVRATPQYQIYDVGILQTGDTAAQAFGISPGGVAVGRSLRTGASQAFRWTLGGGLVALPNVAGRNYCVANGANDNGTVVGTGATALFGSGRLPVVWQNGVVSQLPLPSGQTLGDANSVNASGQAVGSVNSGSAQRGAFYSGGTGIVITHTTANGSYFLTAFGINDAGRIVGQGIDPNNAARNVGIVYDGATNSTFEVGALPGFNGALAFAVGNTGFVTGSSMINQGSGLPFIWSVANAMVPIPLAAGTSQGSGRGVNSEGWVVGNDSGATSIPFLYDGTTTYRLQDLIPAGSGWDLSMNTSSSALGISDNRIITGTGVFNGATHAYAMVPLLQPISAVSRLTHAGAGTFDIDLPLTGTSGVECRNGGGDYFIVVTFSNNLTSGSASVTSGAGTVAGSPTLSGSTMTVHLTGVANAQNVTVSLSVTDTYTQSLADIPVTAGFLVGDTNGDRFVNGGDSIQTRNRAGQATNASNFRSDVNLDGFVNSGDSVVVRARSGTALP